MAICTLHNATQLKRKAGDYHIPHDRERGDLTGAFIIHYCTSFCDNSAKIAVPNETRMDSDGNGNFMA